MGFQYWFEGVIFVTIFLVIIGAACAGVMVLGARMINDLGNFPTRSLQIQMSASWKIFIVEVFAFLLLALFFHIFN